jgi:hypothetical protein
MMCRRELFTGSFALAGVCGGGSGGGEGRMREKRAACDGER